MPLAITDAELELSSVARRFLAERSVRAEARARIDDEVEQLPGCWPDLAALGWLGLHVPTEHGGGGGTLLDLAIVVEAAGAELLGGPFLPTVIAGAVAAFEPSPLRAALLPGLVAGNRTAAVGLTGSITVAGGVASGHAGPVLSAEIASLLVIIAGPDVVILDADADGVAVTRRANLDPTRRAAVVRLDSVAVPSGDVIRGAADRMRPVAITLAAAEAVGGARAAVERAAEYAKGRVQFGRPIGSFQAVKHSLADALADVELATAAVWDAARLAGGGEFPRAAAVAGTLAFKAFERAAKTSIQVHGAIGCTYEHDAHLYLRRATALTALFGPPGSHARAVTAMSAGRRRRAAVDLPATEAERYRQEVRAFRARYETLPEREQVEELAASGYLFPHWPPPWGRGAGAVEQVVVDEELGDLERPKMGLVNWCVPTVIAFGTPDQQDEWVGGTLRGRYVWCQMFSEPDAGSDLAGVRTRAARVEGGWRLTGQKVWTTLAHRANVGLCLARSDPDAPKHAGLSCFVVDMHSPGVEVCRLRELSGYSSFNEVFLDGVLVHDRALIGRPGDGWRAARVTLANERVSMGGATTIPGTDVAFGLLDLVPAASRPDARIGQLLAEHQALDLLGARVVARAVAGLEPGPEANVAKLLASAHEQRVSDLAQRLLGSEAVFRDGGHETWTTKYLGSRVLSIAGGTSEILRSVIAERILRLPREPGLDA
jgi:alkylation response protein AidB-like acyl-CoA dehydrogenase